MGTLISITITSLFLAILFVKNGWSRPVKKLLGYHPSKFVKPFDCLPCMSFWFAILVASGFLIFGWGSYAPTYIVSIMASFVAAYIIESK